MSRRLSTEEFVKIAQQKFGGFYDYSETAYSTSKALVIIKCPEHGSFNKLAGNHLQGQGCPQCGKKRQLEAAAKGSALCKLSTESWIAQARKVHGETYDYSSSKYVGSTKPVTIGCPKHGPFQLWASSHTNDQRGCPDCCRRATHYKGEWLIAWWLASHSINFQRHFSFSDCYNPKTKKKLPFDFWLPDHNLLIEYDGKQHFQPARFSSLTTKHQALQNLEHQQNLDLLKDNYVREKGHQLLRIRFDEDLGKALASGLSHIVGRI